MGCCYSRKTRKIKRVDANENCPEMKEEDDLRYRLEALLDRNFFEKTRAQQKKSSNQNTGNGCGLQDTSYIEETFIEVGMRWKSSSKIVKVETSKQAELETFNEGVNNLFHFI